MKLLRSFLLVLGCLPALAQPVINGVANAASYSPAGLPGADIALGSMFVIFGTGLGPSELTQVSSYPLPTTLAGTRVHINTVSSSGQVDAYMIYTSANQVAAIVPSSLNFSGTVVLTVIYNGQTSRTAVLRLTNSAFGTFTLSQSGLGAAVAQNYVSANEAPFNSLTTPAKPGQLVTLWGTGLGPVRCCKNSQPLPGQLLLNLQVYVGGKAAQTSYYGRSGCCSGIDQIVFAVPAGVSGCSVPVAVVINGVPGNTATIAVSGDGAACTDALGTSSSDIQMSAGNGTARFANVALNHLDGGNPTDSASASFSTLPWVKYAASLSGAPAVGSCVLIQGSGNASYPPSGAAALDAGPALSITGPSGSGQLAKQGNGGYAGVLGPVRAGAYTVSGTGGADVGPFTASLNVPSPLTWTNRTAITSITPGSAVTVNWSGGDALSYVSVQGLAANTTSGLFGIFACTERAITGTFTVPAYITAGLPAGQGIMALSQSGSPARFPAPGIDQGFFTYSMGSATGTLTVGASGGGGKK